MSQLPRVTLASYRVQRCKGLYIPEGSDWGFYMGNMASLAFAATANRTDYPSGEDSTGTPAFSDTTSIDTSITWESRNYNELSQRLSNFSDKEMLVQAAGTDLVMVKTAPLFVDATFEVPSKMVTPTSFRIGPVGVGGFDLVRDVHYAFDNQASLGIILKLPDGYDPETDDEVEKKFTYSRESYKAARYDGLSKPNGLRGAVIVRDTNARGPKFATRFHLVEATADGDQGFIQDTDLSTRTFKGSVYQDPTRLANSAGFFEAIELPAILA